MAIKYLRYFRKKAGLTQEKLAELVDTATNTIARYERGELAPSLRMAHAIAEALGVTESDLINGPEDEEISIIVEIGDLKKEMKKIEMRKGKRKFRLILDDDGALGIHGLAKFESREQLIEQLDKMKTLMLNAYDFQIANNRA